MAVSGDLVRTAAWPRKMMHDLGQVAGEQVIDELADVAVDDAALLDGGDDAGVVVVGQHHVGGLFGHVRAGDAHRHADIGALDRRGVVDAVAGHGHHLVIGAQRIDDAHLVLGRDAGKDVGQLPPRACRAGVVQLVQICAPVSTWWPGREQADALGDGAGGVGIIAGDHDGADAGLARLLQGRVDLRAGRVDHPHQADEDQVFFHLLAVAPARARPATRR